MFSIEVEQTEIAVGPDGGSGNAIGKITIGDLVEEFAMPLGFWAITDYRSSWCKALARLEESPDSMSCLLTSMTDPAVTTYLHCWPLYRDGETVYVQNSLIFLDELEAAFDPSRPWLSIGSRCAVDEDGNLISEWSTSMKSIRTFLGHHCSECA